MSQHSYTSIPDTSDAIYWEIKIQNIQERSSTFIPRDKALHRELKQKAWQAIQAKTKNHYKDRHKVND